MKSLYFYKMENRAKCVHAKDVEKCLNSFRFFLCFYVTHTYLYVANPRATPLSNLKAHKFLLFFKEIELF